MKTTIILLLSVFFVVNMIDQAFGQDAVVSSTLNPYDSVLIGDYVTLEVSASTKKNVKTIWPQVLDTLTSFDIISQSDIDTLDEGGTAKLSQQVILSAYDSGIYFVSGIPFYFIDADGNTLFSKTKPLALRVHTVPVDTSEAYKAIKPPFSAPIKFKDIWPWLLAAVILISLILITVYLIRKNSRDQQTVSAAPAIPAHMVANKKLNLLEQKKLWQQGKVKDYYIELSEIIREYIENRFGIPALESTTMEIISGLQSSKFFGYDTNKLEEILSLSDYVKFAKVKPLAEENANAILLAKDFVKNTVPVIVSREKEGADV